VRRGGESGDLEGNRKGNTRRVGTGSENGGCRGKGKRKGGWWETTVNKTEREGA